LDNGERIQLPKAVRSFLTYLLVEMSNGNAVTIMPVHAELTTQEAADHLNVSRPYLIKLLNAGVLNFHRVGTHRRIRLADLMSYKEKLVRKSDAVLDELAEQAQDLKLGYEVEN